MVFKYIIVDRKTHDLDDNISILANMKLRDNVDIYHASSYTKTNAPKYHLTQNDIILISKILNKNIRIDGMKAEYLDIIHSYLKLFFGRDKIVNLSSVIYRQIIFLYVDVRMKNF